MHITQLLFWTSSINTRHTNNWPDILMSFNAMNIFFHLCFFFQSNKQTKKPLLSQFNRFYVLPSLHEPKYTFTGRFKNWHHSFIRQVHRYMHILSKCASLNLYRYSMGPLIWHPWDQHMSGFQITAKKLTLPWIKLKILKMSVAK